LRNFLIGGAALFCLTMAVAAQQPEPPRKTVAHDPAFTAAQAARGAQVYAANCVGCHLAGLDGSGNPTAKATGAPLTGARFVQDFGEGKISALFNKIMRDMPAGAGKAGSLTEQQYLDVTAYILQQNKFPAGAADLTVDLATDVWIPGAGGAEGLADYTYVAGIGCLNQDPTKSWMLTSAPELKKTDVPAANSTAAVVMPLDAPGEYTFRLLNAYNYDAEPNNGKKVRVSGYLVRLGAEIRVNVQTLQMVSASCGK
jgi:mono/diheme cytochrome c family protein